MRRLLKVVGNLKFSIVWIRTPFGKSKVKSQKQEISYFYLSFSCDNTPFGKSKVKSQKQEINYFSSFL